MIFHYFNYMLFACCCFLNTTIYAFGIAFDLTTILLSHLFQHVVQSLCLQVYNKRLFLPAVQVFEKLPVTGIIKVLDTYGADLPTVLACLFHDSLQYCIPYDKKWQRGIWSACASNHRRLEPLSRGSHLFRKNVICGIVSESFLHQCGTLSSATAGLWAITWCRS